jgi:uncharacterized protein (TIGR03435 family)
MMQSASSDRSRIVCQQQTMAELVRELQFLLKATVTDTTGLTAKYDLTLSFAGSMGPGGAITSSLPASPPDDAEPLPDIFSAIQSQLGLKLEPKKAPVEVFVVDRMEKTPAGN